MFKTHEGEALSPTIITSTQYYTWIGEGSTLWLNSHFILLLFYIAKCLALKKNWFLKFYDYLNLNDINKIYTYKKARISLYKHWDLEPIYTTAIFATVAETATFGNSVIKKNFDWVPSVTVSATSEKIAVM